MIRRIYDALFNMTAVLVAVVTLSSFLIASYELETWPFADRRPLRARFEFYRVGRTTLDPFLSAPGRVESSRRTVVQCELENIAGSTTTGGSSGASTMIWVIPEGTMVQKGDVLATLDASTYEELLRQQTILVEQAKASFLQAQLTNEIAKIALREYVEGTVKEQVQEMEGSITFARANLEQAKERLDWTMKMNKKGYASIAQIQTDKQTVMTQELALQSQLSAYELFQRFTLPKTKMTLQADITTSQTSLDSEQVKLNRQVERYELLKKQVDRCTIRAPHDGVVYYYFNPTPRRDTENVTIEEGMAVRQEQKLFYLPDLSDMEVQVNLNESIVNRVSPGLRATAEFEALPQLKLEGRLDTVSQIPNQVNPRGEDVRYFVGIVKLKDAAQKLKPGLTSVVTFELPHEDNVLAVPHQAVRLEGGKQVCYLAAEDHLIPREVKVGKTTTDLIEITDGLEEGEEIVLNPPARDARPRPLADFDESGPWPKVDLAKAAASAAARGRSASGDRPGAGQFGGGSERRKGNRPPGDPSQKRRRKADADL